MFRFLANKKTKIIVGILAIAVVLFLIGYFFVWPHYQDYQAGKVDQKYSQLAEKLTEYFKADKYGGQTPQETYNLYLTALKNGDLDLASRYFYWTKQVVQKNRLIDLQNKGQLQEYINSLPQWSDLREQNVSDQNKKRYVWQGASQKPITVQLPKGNGEFINQTIEPGGYQGEIDFEINNHAGIWKIYSL